MEIGRLFTSTPCSYRGCTYEHTHVSDEPAVLLDEVRWLVESLCPVPSTDAGLSPYGEGARDVCQDILLCLTQAEQENAR